MTNATANDEVLRRIAAAEPAWVDVARAGDVLPGFSGLRLGHAGPPVTWARMFNPQRGAAVASVLFERWPATPDEALALLASGQVQFTPNHDLGAVNPMAGRASAPAKIRASASPLGAVPSRSASTSPHRRAWPPARDRDRNRAQDLRRRRMIGVGMVPAPLKPFVEASAALMEVSAAERRTCLRHPPTVAAPPVGARGRTLSGVPLRHPASRL